MRFCRANFPVFLELSSYHFGDNRRKRDIGNFFSTATRPSLFRHGWEWHHSSKHGSDLIDTGLSLFRHVWEWHHSSKHGSDLIDTGLSLFRNGREWHHSSDHGSDLVDTGLSLFRHGWEWHHLSDYGSDLGNRLSLFRHGREWHHSPDPTREWSERHQNDTLPWRLGVMWCTLPLPVWLILIWLGAMWPTSSLTGSELMSTRLLYHSSGVAESEIDIQSPSLCYPESTEL